MKLPESLLIEMGDLFLSYKDNRGAVENFFSGHRKSIKLLVDSVWEQLVESICAVQPRSSKHARLLINESRNAGTISPDASEVCIALNAVLENYWVLESADYVEYEQRIRYFLTEPLRLFCLALSNAPAFANRVPARRLAASLEGLVDA